MATWEERFRSLYREAFERAGLRLVERPLQVGEAVTAKVADRISDRVMTLLSLEGDDAVVEGFMDGVPDIEHMPVTSLVRAQDMFEILLELGEQHGLDRTEETEVPDIRH